MKTLRLSFQSDTAFVITQLLMQIHRYVQLMATHANHSLLRSVQFIVNNAQLRLCCVLRSPACHM